MLDYHLYASLPDHIRDHLKTLPDISEARAYAEICRLVHVPYLLPTLSQVDIAAARTIGLARCRELRFLPLYRSQVVMVTAMSRPWTRTAIKSVQEVNYDELRIVGTPETHLLQLIDQLAEVHGPAPTVVRNDVREVNLIFGWGLGRDRDLFRDIIRNAFYSNASDIHLEPMADRLAVKFRINGLLVVQQPVELRFLYAALDAVKTMAGLPVSDKVSLKDSRFTVEIYPGRRLDFRLAVLPTQYGENMVLRLLDSSKIAALMGKLPFTGHRLKVFMHCLNQENGLILLTGPTGSGKSTTLYTALLALDLATYNVRTVEDPIEYQLPKIIQTQVDRANNVTTTTALRAILRADPDVILVGEIRDNETASLAISAANTGHLVLSTLHTNDAVTIIPRLVDLGLTRQEVQENFTLGIAQRLIPVICSKCKSTQPVTDTIRRHYEYYHLPPPGQVFEATGCYHCRGTGIVGRQPVFQFIHNQGEIAQAIGRGADSVEISALNAKYFNPLIIDALFAVANGSTSYGHISYLETTIIPANLTDGQLSPNPLAPL